MPKGAKWQVSLSEVRFSTAVSIADALREYGFADAIYITGGKCHSFYRTPDGKPHNIGDDTQHPHKKYHKIVPWIIFKAR